MNGNAVDKLAKHTDFNSFIIVVCCAVCVTAILYVADRAKTLNETMYLQMKLNHDLIDHRAEQTEKIILDFMDRTVNRWEKLQNENPQLKVPLISEPPILPTPVPTTKPK